MLQSPTIFGGGTHERADLIVRFFLLFAQNTSFEINARQGKHLETSAQIHRGDVIFLPIQRGWGGGIKGAKWSYVY